MTNHQGGEVSNWVMFVGYFDVANMSVHDTIEHLTEAQEENYKAQICAVLQSQHFEVDRFGIQLTVVADQVLVHEQAPANPLSRSFGQELQQKMLNRIRLQYKVALRALPAPKTSGLILPGKDQALTAMMLRPLPEDGELQ